MRETSAEEVEARLLWIEANLDTTGEWSLEDYQEFYEGDVRLLLTEVRRLQEENGRYRAALAGIEKQLEGARSARIPTLAGGAE
jgi:hypothetical protein